MATVTYGRRKVEPKTDSAGNGALPRTIGAGNHVQVRAWSELDPVVGHKVPELDADNRAWHEPTEAIEPPPAPI